MLAAGARSVADESEGRTALKFVQDVPPAGSNCQLPPVLSTAVTAMPSACPGSESVMPVPPRDAMTADTRVPVSEPSAISSVMPVRAGLPLLSSTGAAVVMLNVPHVPLVSPTDAASKV